MPTKNSHELTQQLDLFQGDMEVQAVQTILDLKLKARKLRQRAGAIERLVEELEDSLNAQYS